jgi:hypothetical protein
LGAALRPLFTGLLALLLPLGPAAADDLHTPWTTLLRGCVSVTRDGHSTAVDYDCFARKRDALGAYLTALGAVDRPVFDAWDEPRQLAFLINAYNAGTVELILTAWPDLDSIRDLGGLFRSPWEKSFIPLLGETRTLDDIEHGMIREPGRFDEPRIHFAVNCASIGCPALRRKAYRAETLEEQLEDQTKRFLADPSRNRFRDGRLQISPLFKWYREDFERGWRGMSSLEGFLARYAGALGLDGTQVEALRNGDIPIRFLEYDWSLNDQP